MKKWERGGGGGDHLRCGYPHEDVDDRLDVQSMAYLQEFCLLTGVLPTYRRFAYLQAFCLYLQASHSAFLPHPGSQGGSCALLAQSARPAP